MGIKRRFIPFALLPKSWGLSGAEREEAEARYTLTGEDLERRLLEIRYPIPRTPEEDLAFKREKLGLDFSFGHIGADKYQRELIELEHPNKTTKEYKIAVLNHRLAYGEIEQREYDEKSLELNHPDKNSIEYKSGMAKIAHKYNDLTDQQLEKELATIRGEPYIQLIKAELKYNEGSNGFEFELDWNKFFIEDLLKHGWTGLTEEEIVDSWFTTTCQDIFAEDEEFLVDDFPIVGTTQVTRNGDNTEYS